MFVSAGIHVFKVCSCILDHTNQRAMQGTECVSMGARLTQQCLPVSERHCAVRWEEKKRNPKVEMRGAVLGAALRNHHANAERTLLQGKCLVSHPCCLWLLCTGIREKTSSVRRERIMQDKAGLSFLCEDFLPQTEGGTVLVPAQLPRLLPQRVPQL